MGSVTIERLDATYVVDAPQAGTARSRLDAAFASRLAGACRSRLSPLDHGEGVWLIRSLNLDLTLPELDHDDALVDVFAARLYDALAATIRAGPDGDGVLFFPTRGAYLARLCADLAEGRLAGRWYADAADAVRWLPAGAAIATLLRREPERIDETMTVLRAIGMLDRVIDTLGENDARAIVEAWTPPGSATQDALREAATVLRALGHSSFIPSSLVRLLARIRTSGSPEAPADARAAAEIVLAFAEMVERGGAAVIDELRAGRVPAAAIGGSPAAPLAPAVARAVSGGGPWLEALGVGVATSERAQPGAWTRFGGALLLLPALAGCTLFDELDEEQRGSARLAVLAACFGRARRDEAVADPVLAMLCGAYPGTTPDDVAGVHAAGRIPSRDVEFLLGDDESVHTRGLAGGARDMLDGFARRLLGFRRSSAAYLFKNFLSGAASLVIDDERIDARLEAPPLALVLRMGGIDGSSFTVPWVAQEITIWLDAS